MMIIESKLREALPELTEGQVTHLAAHLYFGYHVELEEGVVPQSLVASGWYAFMSTEDYMVIMPKVEAIPPHEQARKLTEADVPSWSLVYAVIVPRAAATTVEARKFYEMRQEMLVRADVHYRDCAQDVFLIWHLSEVAPHLLKVLERQLKRAAS